MGSVELTVGLEFEAALVDMMIRHRNRQSSGEPDGEEILWGYFYRFVANIIL